jgi:peroxiredoxin
LADYRKHSEEIRARGANVVAVAVDPPEKSEPVRRELNLPFAILCDTDRRVVRDWDIYNAREKGGIAKPAVFLIDRNRTVRYVSIDSVATRVPASEIVRLLGSVAEGRIPRRKVYIPTPADFVRAVRHSLRRSPRPPRR